MKERLENGRDCKTHKLQTLPKLLLLFHVYVCDLEAFCLDNLKRIVLLINVAIFMSEML